MPSSRTRMIVNVAMVVLIVAAIAAYLSLPEYEIETWFQI